MHARIGIVGGSIAGCAAALAVRRAGFDVTIFERARSLRDRGLGVAMPETTYQDLTTAGYLDPSLPVHRVAHRLWVIAEPGEPTGRVLWRQPTPALATSWGHLWRVLADRVASCYHADEHVTAVNSDGVITTKNGHTHPFDLVIGADGHQSVVRSVISRDTRAQDAGYALWRGTVTEQKLPQRLTTILESVFVTVVFAGGHAVFYLIPAQSGQRLLTWAVYTRPRALTHAGIGEVWDTVERFLPPAWADTCRLSEVLCVHPVRDLTATTYIANPLLLAGDAATLARPHTASGAVKAILDAVRLERALRTSADLSEVLARYDADRRPQGNQLVEIGRRIGSAMVEQTPRWASMTPDDISSWTAAALGGYEHYLYRRSPQQLTT